MCVKVGCGLCVKVGCGLCVKVGYSVREGRLWIVCEGRLLLLCVQCVSGDTFPGPRGKQAATELRYPSYHCNVDGTSASFCQVTFCPLL